MSMFKTSSGQQIPDLKEYVRNWLSSHPVAEIYVGCDSQDVGDRISYAVTVCLYEIGKGGHIITCNDYENKNLSFENKLWQEVTRSVETAEMLKELDVKIIIHIDYNSNPKHKSNQLYEAGLGYAIGMGYQAVGKPYAWAATHVADRECR